MVLFVLRKLILQMHMHSHPVGLDVWFLVGPFVYFHSSCMWTVKALARLHRFAGSPEPSLVAYVKSTIISSWLKLFCSESRSKRTTFHAAAKTNKNVENQAFCTSRTCYFSTSKLIYLYLYWRFILFLLCFLFSSIGMFSLLYCIINSPITDMHDRHGCTHRFLTVSWVFFMQRWLCTAESH